jgi:acetyl esterase/lipase
MRWFWDQYTTDHLQRDEITASTLRASVEQLLGLPPALVISGEADGSERRPIHTGQLAVFGPVTLFASPLTRSRTAVTRTSTCSCSEERRSVSQWCTTAPS